MYLKNIEVHGFKSFAQKINFEFHNGITGIVGPNGSGKSNVGDAVRWVLGEQSAKQLRGGNMQDVIFSGTETRKPLSFASVAITLDNSDHKLPVDFNEVTVTRRLYRSGESEYLINGSACRLKDINEMFYDTGIGKEGYSIIGQGQIDKILSGKPEERRELFDEAAGIVKFKRRKATTIKKLQDEQANLVRVTDILSELTRQLSPLAQTHHTAVCRIVCDGCRCIVYAHIPFFAECHGVHLLAVHCQFISPFRIRRSRYFTGFHFYTGQRGRSFRHFTCNVVFYCFFGRIHYNFRFLLVFSERASGCSQGRCHQQHTYLK